MTLPTKDNLSTLRKYTVEFFICCLLCSTVYLFNEVKSLNAFIREKFVPIIEQNTNALNNLKQNQR